MSYLVTAAFAVLVVAIFVVRSHRRLPMVPVPERESSRIRIVILGGGFAGVGVAAALESLQRDEDFDIVLVNKENHFVFQPLLPEVISGTIGLVDVVSPIRRLLPRTELHVREVEAVDLCGAEDGVTTKYGLSPASARSPVRPSRLRPRNRYRLPRPSGLPEHAFPSQKPHGRAHAAQPHCMIRALEEAAIERHDAVLRKRLLTFVVAGGGFAGRRSLRGAQ